MLYEIGFFIFSIFYLPTLIFKGKLHSSFAERFGRYDRAKERALFFGKDRIWIQAVSVGEVALLKELVGLLKERFPGHDVVISTITKTGNDLAKKIFSRDAIIIYFPLDFSFIVRKVIRVIKPELYIMVETEIWPNLLRRLASDSIPSILINGRISDKSIARYRLAKPFLKSALDGISTFCMQDAIDADRIISLGARPDRVKITGNMKFDMAPALSVRPPEAIRSSLGITAKDELLVAGSTHAGEEEIVLETFKGLSSDFPRLKLLIAPRHIDRVDEVERVIKRFGFEPARVSKLNEIRKTPARRSHEGEGGGNERRILILDTIGHLNDAYSIATLVFIGGSLVRHGGQNPIEPAIFEKPIIFGPHMFNFKYIASAFLKNRAAVQAADRKELSGKCALLLKNAHERNRLGLNARRVISENRGATKRNLEAISALLR